MSRNLDTSDPQITQSIHSVLAGQSKYAIFTHKNRTSALILLNEQNNGENEWKDKFWQEFTRKDLMTYAFVRLDHEATASNNEELTRFLCIAYKGEEVGIVFKSKFVFFVKEFGKFMEGKCHDLIQLEGGNQSGPLVDFSQIEQSLISEKNQGLFVISSDGKSRRVSGR